MLKGYMKYIAAAALLAALLLAGTAWWSGEDRREPPRVVILATETTLAGKFEMVRTAAQETGMALRYHYVEEMDGEALRQALEGVELLLIDAPMPRDWMKIAEALGPLGDSLPQRRLEMRNNGEYAGLEPQQVEDLRLYYRHGGIENMRRMFTYVAARILGESDAEVAEAVEFPPSAIYHPRHAEVFTSVEDYFAWLREEESKPVIGVLMMQSFLGSGTHAHIDDLIARIEKNGAIPFAFYVPIQEEGAIGRFAAVDGKPVYDVLISFQIMRVNQQREHFQSLGVPVLQASNWRDGDAEHFRKDPVGIPLFSVPFHLAVPEYAGATDPLVVSAVENGTSVAIPEQMEAMARKALRLARLQHTPNEEKKVAIFFYNYPSGEKNLSASFLNVPRSLANVTGALAAEGYRVEPMDAETITEGAGAALRRSYSKEELASLVDEGKADLLPLEHYRRWFGALPSAVRAEVVERWGEPQNDPMVLSRDGADYFVVPRIRNGNLMILPQPRRGRQGDDAERSLYHDTKSPFHHFYMAVYLHVREGFGADALVHFGTHGTQEWSPGKERGLWVYDYPYLVLGDTPVLYPYIVDNIGEATQAKRRGRATIISHMTPPFAPAGLHEALVPVHDLIHEYEMLDEGAVKEKTRAAILDITGEDLFKDLGWDHERAAADFETFFDELHDYLHDLALQTQPLGLHTFGGVAAPEHRLTTVMQMLGWPFYERLGLEDLDELFVDDHNKIHESPPFKILQRHILEGRSLDSIRDEELRDLIALGREYYRNLSESLEMTNLLAGLSGRYIETSYGGDPIRNPDSLPTGRNLYGFDPSKVPTAAAWRAGQAAVEDLIAAYVDEHGRPPEKLAFSLWSTETMRHLGVLEAQVFHALGVKPVWDQGARITGVEVVPREELGRPRVDVVLSATGLYRDHFPNVMAHMAEAVAVVAALEEPDNAVRANTLALYERLLGEGIPADEAHNMALTRIFSNESGSYGTGLDDAIQASDSWEGEEKLADLYLNRMQHAFGPDQSSWGRRYPSLNLFAEQLKGVDAAVLARSSNLYGMLTTDDPFQYLGGLSLAVRQLTGRSPSLYISNLRDPARTKVDSAARFLAMELQTRYFHPGWIESMKNEDLAGTLAMSNPLNNFWGWQVVDPDVVRDDQWQSFHDIYVNDKYNLELREWFEQLNPQALAAMVERMLEAVRKEYWDAGEQTMRELVETWLDLESRFDVHATSSMLEDYVAQLAVGFGLGGAAPDAAAGGPQIESISGLQLAPVAAAAPMSAPLLLLSALGGILAVFFFGMVMQMREQQRLARMARE
ncbi:cobaltochelatase subunit CobN [Geoalkalibacter halelectricus]|uniref:cobaltochelatase subunit CobN n=1 Tax=Geoalkalibacter halelectricus TaxID=2847045 RepID=UPI00267029AB|nr:cobaltochelatase subunit CobN [Geoalkalibacter halelectricus]MDO3380321.1 cobaltochelatase subunit CobN [Geoalkalibacter halelectricus]